MLQRTYKEVWTMITWIKKRFSHKTKAKDSALKFYPNSNSCIRKDMSHVRPQQMPPLMVRKAAWRR
ncbi:MAG: hypothetical protein KAJ07_07495 [Planctomycetes bacterium]|nr:hypothetical protein [Planctomycetota bacterium]